MTAHATFPGPAGEHLIELADPSVTVIFNGTGYSWTTRGPEITEPRAREVVIALLRVALRQLVDGEPS